MQTPWPPYLIGTGIDLAELLPPVEHRHDEDAAVLLDERDAGGLAGRPMDPDRGVDSGLMFDVVPAQHQ
jgi:hypothetical protein